MAQLAQVVGALLILAAYALARFGVLNQRSYWYISLNLAGATALPILAWYEEQWGFLLLEGVWALVSAAALVDRLRKPAPAWLPARWGRTPTAPA